MFFSRFPVSVHLQLAVNVHMVADQLIRLMSGHQSNQLVVIFNRTIHFDCRID